MRLSLALVLAFAASPAWAQPVVEPAGEPPQDPPAEQPPATETPPSPTPEAGKELDKQPPELPTEIAPATSAKPGAEPEQPLDLGGYHARDRGFRFGSYGRVLAGSDLRGGKPEPVRVVAHGPRIVEASYLELEFSYGFERRVGDEGQSSYVIVRPIITLAFDDTLFHDTGKFDAQPALRNMFVDGRIGENVSLWVGSRMYRGDDIYLFDYWPLDDINTVGGGVIFKRPVYLRAAPQSPDDKPDQLELAAHVGFNRLQNEFQFQEIEVANPVQGATIVEQLNRQRTVASASASYTAMPHGAGIGMKLKLHGEYHALPSGTRKRTDGTFESLPADRGFLIGAELGAFGFSDNKQFRRHLNLFARYAKGLAAFDELAPPTTFGSNLETTKANELTFGASGNWDHALGNVMLGALSRRFIDADSNTTDADDGWEYAIDARPLVRVVPDFFVGADVSYQARFPKGLNNNTLRAEDPAIFQLAPMLVWSPMGPSAYDRPQIRLVYRAAHLNQAALDEYVVQDPRHAHEWTHFLGLQAEWWFNSSTYR